MKISSVEEDKRRAVEAQIKKERGKKGQREKREARPRKCAICGKYIVRGKCVDEPGAWRRLVRPGVKILTFLFLTLPIINLPAARAADCEPPQLTIMQYLPDINARAYNTDNIYIGMTISITDIQSRIAKRRKELSEVLADCSKLNALQWRLAELRERQAVGLDVSVSEITNVQQQVLALRYELQHSAYLYDDATQQYIQCLLNHIKPIKKAKK